MLGWMSRRRSQAPPLATASYINLLIALRCIFNELAYIEQLPGLADLIRRVDIPRLPHRLPRPLTSEQDQLLQREFVCLWLRKTPAVLSLSRYTVWGWTAAGPPTQ